MKKGTIYRRGVRKTESTIDNNTRSDANNERGREGGGVEGTSEAVDEVGLERVGEEEDRTANGRGEALWMSEWREMDSKNVDRVVHVSGDIDVLYDLIALAELRALHDFIIQPFSLSFQSIR